MPMEDAVPVWKQWDRIEYFEFYASNHGNNINYTSAAYTILRLLQLSVWLNGRRWL